MTPIGHWLERSGQAWKMRVAVLSVFLGFALFALAFVARGATAAIAGCFAFVFFSVNVLLPLFVRCAVCGLQLDTFSGVRRLPRDQQLKWIESLEACPVCGDDGRAEAASRERWRTSDLAPEEPYWSLKRILLAVLATAVFVGGGFAIGARYRVG